MSNSSPISGKYRLQQMRVWARLGFTAALTVIPQPLVGRIRDHFGAADPHGRTRLGPLVRVLRHRTLRPLDSFTLYDNPDVKFVAIDSRLVRFLYWYGQRGHEGCESDWWIHLCRQVKSVLEIGANIGFYSVLGASSAPSAQYTAVEAHPLSVRVLRRNLELNCLDRVQVLHGAVVPSAHESEVELAIPDLEKYAAPTGAFVIGTSEGVAGGRPASRTIAVPAIEASDLAQGMELIKLDIEGAEGKVLTAMMPTLLRERPVLVVEAVARGLRTASLRDALYSLSSHNYEALALCPDRLQRIDPQRLMMVDLLSEFGAWDLIMMPSEKRVLLDDGPTPIEE